MIIDKLPLVAASALLVFAATVESPAVSASVDPELLHGYVEQWRLDTQGTVYIQLRHPDPDAERGSQAPEVLTWLQTPPPRTPQVNVEEMILGILLRLDGAAQPPSVTVAVQQERGHGEEPDEALPIVWIGRP